MQISGISKRESSALHDRPLNQGRESLLRLSGWPKVERVLQLIDAVEALGIAADAAPDYWHHVHNRRSVNETQRPKDRQITPRQLKPSGG
jgi:Protein of unknown function (DUF2840)